jgi:copper chaperone
MKFIVTLSLGLLALTLSAAEPKPGATTTNQFKITGMHCEGCAGGITSELKLLKGVSFATVSLTNKLAVVAYDTNKVTVKQIEATVKEAGYQAELIKR